MTAGLSVCAVPIVELCHHCWGEGTPPMWDYDLATVDCRLLYSTYHCLQRLRHFESNVSMVCTRAGPVGGDSCSAEGVPTWDAGGVGTGGVNSSGANGGASCRMHQGAATKPAQPIIITVCVGRWGGGSGDGIGLSGVWQGRELTEWRSQGGVG